MGNARNDELVRNSELTNLLDQLEDLIECGKSILLSGKVTVDKESMLETIRDIRLKLPTEVQQSIWIVEERKKIIEQAQNQAHLIIEEAREQAQTLIETDQITQFAKERAENIITTAKEDALQMQYGAIDYAQDTCKDVEEHLKATLESIHGEVQAFESYITDMLREIYDNRQELKELSNRIQDDAQLK